MTDGRALEFGNKIMANGKMDANNGKKWQWQAMAGCAQAAAGLCRVSYL
jgi:hypothetical protein